jgi:hypothetical protein
MPSSLTDRARRYLGDAARAFAQASVEGAVAVFLAVTFSYAVEHRNEAFPAWLQVLVCALLLLAGAWTGTVLYTLGAWSARARWAATAVGAAAALLYGFAIADLELRSEVWRAFLLVAAAVLWVAAMPAVGGPRASSVDRVRAVNGAFLVRVLGALLYTAALFAGLALALGAIDNLFELKLDDTIYAHVWGWLFLVLAPLIIVGGLSDYARPGAAPSAVGGAVHRMAAFLLPPLLVLYYAILYAYTIRMAVTGEVPKNLLSPIVLAAGALGALTLYLFEPRPDDGAGARSAGARYLRYVPPLFLPLGALGIWAILLRTTQYGWTENRIARFLLVIVLAALAIGGTIQLARRRRLSLHVAPLALAIVLLLVCIGPWSALVIARRSQQARLAEVMARAGVSDASTAARPQGPPRIIPTRLYDEFRDITQYLAQSFGPRALPPFLAAHVDEPAAVYDLPRLIGLERAATPRERRPFRSAGLRADAGVDVGGVRVYRIGVSERQQRSPSQYPADIVGPPSPVGGVITNAGVLDRNQLRIRIAEETVTVDLQALIGLLRSSPVGNDFFELSPDRARLDVTDAAGRRRGSFVVFLVQARTEAGVLWIMSIQGLLLLDTAFRTAR